MTDNQFLEREDLPKELDNTDVYMVVPNMGIVLDGLKRVPDIEEGGTRTKRYGAWLAVNVIPSLNDQNLVPGSPVLLPPCGAGCW